LYVVHAITKYHPLVINKKLRNTNSTQTQHKFNKFNEIWPKLTNFLPELSTQIEHKFQSRFIYVTPVLLIIK
jgi:hypothetical protein